MLSYCLRCRKKQKVKIQIVSKTKNGRIMFLSKCAVYHSKRSKFFRQQETSGPLNNLGIKATLSKIPFVGPLLF